ncbi:MAG: GTPase HflX [Rickettsiales bacterium]
MSLRTLVIHPVTTKSDDERSLLARLEEGVGLASAIDLQVVGAHIAKLRSITPATLLGKGKVEEFAAMVEADEIGLVVMDCALTPIQQRNLETNLGCKVIDRTALILEIFGARARTNEGKLQVELASLTYQKSRLVRSWTHLERQRGGFGFLGGPGESQIEIDRRLISERIDKIKKQLEKVVRTRELHRAKRRDIPYPVVALVGYTNAGKSTLFNRLTQSEVMAKDLLFATLDPTIRSLTLPSGLKVMLSDTVGFISNLPTELVAAFRATLEEVLEADVLIHVRDISCEDTLAQKHDVEKVMKNLFGNESFFEHLIEAHNKVDKLDPLAVAEDTALPIVRVSALSGEGCAELLERIEAMLSAHLMEAHHFALDATNGKALAWLYAHGQVTNRKDEEEKIHVHVHLSNADAERFKRMIGN